MYSFMGMVAQAAADEGLTFQKVLESVPLDPLSVFAMGLMAVAVGVVVYFGIKSNAPDPSRPVRPALEEEETVAVAAFAREEPLTAREKTAAAARQETAPVPVQDTAPAPGRPVARPNPVPLSTLAGRGPAVR